MRNGNAVPLRTLLLAVSLALTGGCDSGGTMPGQTVGGAAQAEWPSARHQVDAARKRVWFLTREGLFLHEAGRQERIAVPLPGWIWADEPYACMPDIALGPKGDAVITSNVVPVVWRVDAETLAVSEHALALDSDGGRDVGFSALAYSPPHRAFLAASYAHGSLWKIDPRLERAEKIVLTGAITQACGLAVRPRNSQQVLGRQSDVCVITPRGGWSINFAPDWRSAYVGAAPCAEASSQS